MYSGAYVLFNEYCNVSEIFIETILTKMKIYGIIKMMLISDYTISFGD